MGSERLQGEEQFHTKNYLLEMSRFHAKMRLKSAPQKLNLLNGKSYIKKLYTRLGKVMSDSFRNFFYVCNYVHLKSFAWKRVCPISSKFL